MSRKCVVLYSGGLDSILTIHIMKSLGFEVYALFIKTPFFSKDTSSLKKQLEKTGVKLHERSNNEKYMDMVRHPKFGYGKNMNPCIDCKIFFLKEAKDFMEEVGADFVVTGEVLGQRPMSQASYPILRLIEKQAGLKDLVLRPLSAKVLPETKMEKDGFINRENLFDINGRGRKKQLELAKHFSIEDFETPAGGCLLTDKHFAYRLKDALKYNKKKYLEDEIKLLKIGRHFRINDLKFIVSRDEKETNYIFEAFYDKLPFLRCVDAQGACAIFLEEPGANEIEKGASILKRYSKKANEIEYHYKSASKIINPKPISNQDIDAFRLDV